MLKLQRHARNIVNIESNESDSSGRSIIYGSDSETAYKKALLNLKKDYGYALSPKSRNLQAGIFPKIKTELPNLEHSARGENQEEF